MTRANAAPMLIIRSISSPSPWSSGYRQLAWKSWDRGRGNRLQGHIRSGPRSCHWQKRRHRKRCRRRRDGPGTWLSFGIAQETGSITSVPFGEKENFRDASPRVPARGPRRVSLSLAEGLRHRVLLSAVAVQAHEREEAVRLSVFRFAVREAGKPSKPPPVRRAGVSVVPIGQCLRGKGSEELRKYSGVLEPGLKVAGAGLDNRTWVEAVGREPRKRGLAEIVEGGETMLPGWANVDVRAVGIAVLEQRKSLDERRGRDAIESRKHSTLTQDTDIVERCLDMRVDQHAMVDTLAAVKTGAERRAAQRTWPSRKASRYGGQDA
jgi:hypothetical protein